MYDDNSESFGPPSSHQSVLVRAIYETEFRKILKRTPVQLVGGLEAWKNEFGDTEVVDGSQPVANGTAALVEPRKPQAQPVPPTMSRLVQSSAPPIAMPTPISEPSRYWTPPSLDTQTKGPSLPRDEAVRYSLPPRPTGDSNLTNGYVPAGEPPRPLSRRPIIAKPSSMSMSISSSRPLPESGNIPPSINGVSPIQYPQFPKALSPATSGSSSYSSPGTYNIVSPPPQASINPTFSRRRSDYVDQSQEALSGVGARTPIDYPELSARHILRPPPAVASSTMERQDNRPRIMQEPPSALPGGPPPPTIKSDYPVTYWSDIQIGTSGLKNLGNTCYMNATIQCLSATVPFARFFTGNSHTLHP